MENEQPHESSNYFRFSKDEIGHLTKGCTIERLAVMNRNAHEHYAYDNFLPMHNGQQSPLVKPNPMSIVDPNWRASVVKCVRV